jgi:hypothetical protein
MVCVVIPITMVIMLLMNFGRYTEIFMIAFTTLDLLVILDGQFTSTFSLGEYCLCFSCA